MTTRSIHDPLEPEVAQVVVDRPGEGALGDSGGEVVAQDVQSRTQIPAVGIPGWGAPCQEHPHGGERGGDCGVAQPRAAPSRVEHGQAEHGGGVGEVDLHTHG